jgi:hypothetical protein
MNKSVRILLYNFPFLPREGVCFQLSAEEVGTYGWPLNVSSATTDTA